MRRAFCPPITRVCAKFSQVGHRRRRVRWLIWKSITNVFPNALATKFRFPKHPRNFYPRIRVITVGRAAGFLPLGFFRIGRHRVMIFREGYRENARFGVDYRRL